MSALLPTFLAPTPAVGRVALSSKRAAHTDLVRVVVWSGARGAGQNGISWFGADAQPLSAAVRAAQENLFSSQCPRPGNPAGATELS